MLLLLWMNFSGLGHALLLGLLFGIDPAENKVIDVFWAKLVRWLVDLVFKSKASLGEQVRVEAFWPHYHLLPHLALPSTFFGLFSGEHRLNQDQEAFVPEHLFSFVQKLVSICFIEVRQNPVAHNTLVMVCQYAYGLDRHIKLVNLFRPGFRHRL